MSASLSMTASKGSCVAGCGQAWLSAMGATGVPSARPASSMPSESMAHADAEELLMHVPCKRPGVPLEFKPAHASLRTCRSPAHALSCIRMYTP